MLEEGRHRARWGRLGARRDEAAYLAQFGEVPPAKQGTVASNSPMAVISAAGNNAPGVEVMPKEIDPADAIIEDVIIQEVLPQAEPPPDLGVIRDELQQLDDARPAQ